MGMTKSHKAQFQFHKVFKKETWVGGGSRDGEDFSLYNPRCRHYTKEIEPCSSPEELRIHEHTIKCQHVSIQRFYRPHLMLTACEKENVIQEILKDHGSLEPHADNLQPHANCCTSKQVNKNKTAQGQITKYSFRSECPHFLLTEQ